jgi:hypothetical protein
MPESRLPPAEDAYRAAVMRRLARAPLTTPERMGAYASLLYDSLPDTCSFLLLLYRGRRLLGHTVLFRGRAASAEAYCSRIRRAYDSFGASQLVLCASVFDPASDAYDVADSEELSRAALWCEREGMQVAEAILLSRSGYLPLYRYYGGQK